MRLEPLETRTLLSSSIPLNSISWTPIGPAPISHGQIAGSNAVSGRVTGIAADPNDPNTVYLTAAGGGVWKTSDGGQSWTPLTDNQATLMMGAIAVSKSNPQVIYAGTGEANGFPGIPRNFIAPSIFYGRGVLKSSDGGNTWALLGSNVFDRRAISKVVIDPNDSNTVYVAVGAVGVTGLPGNTGIWKTTDGGNTWTNTTTSITTQAPFSDLVMDPSNPTTLYAAVGDPNGASSNGIYKTTDGGATWAPAGNAPSGSNIGRTAIAIAPSSPQTLYASISDPATQGLVRMVVSTDGGKTWADTPAPPPDYLGGQAFYDDVLIVDPRDANVLYAAGSLGGFDPTLGFTQSVIVTRDGGANWEDVTVGVDGNGVHVDQHALAFDASGRLLDGNDGGIWRLDNANAGSEHWSDLNTNLNITQFIGIALNPQDANIAYGGTQDNGTNKFNDSLGWQHIQDGDGGYTRVDFSNPNTVYHTFFYGGQGFIERSDDGGQTWNGISGSIGLQDNGNFYPPYIMDPSNSSRLLLGTDQIYETTDKGANWKSLSAPNSNGWNPNGDPVDALAVSKTDPNTIYATAGGHVFVTTDDGATWTQHDIPTATDHFGAIEVDPTDSMVAYAARDNFNDASNTGHVFKTTDGGATWTDITGNLPDIPSNSLAIATIQGKTVVFLGTDTGVFSSSGNGMNWSRFGLGMPNVRVSQLEVNQNLNILAAGTHGRGMWEITLGDALTVAVTPPPATEGQSLSGVKLATFLDAIGTDALSNYTVMIDWGDNSTSTGTVALDPNGGVDVLGTHAYAEEGSYTITVTVNDSDGTTGTGTGSIDVADAALTATGTTLAPLAENGTLTAVPIASFTDADPAGTVSDYTATIDWGDKSTSTGTVVPNGSGGFNVLGTHTYTEGGTYKVKVTIDDAAFTATATTTQVVTDPPITATGQTFSVDEGTTSQFVIGTLTDADPNTSPSEYTVNITWGDGTTSTGTVAPNTSGGYNVLGSHGYEKGMFTVTFTVTDAGGSTSSASSTANVNDAALTGSGKTIQPIEGQNFPGVIGTLTDANVKAVASDYIITIDWGDGHTTPGTAVPQGNGVFDIKGSNPYARFGTYTITINVTDVDGKTTSFQSTANVGDAPLIANGTALQADEGVPFNATVTTFTDTNPSSQPSDFTATIDWGDGTKSAGVISADLNGGYDVKGTHTFEEGSPLITVTINDVGGASTVSIGTAQINDAPITATGSVVFATEFVPANNLAVATFSDKNTNAPLKDFTAVINWGDGLSSVGVITPLGNGLFSVHGSHTFNESGPYPVSVTINDVGGASAVATSAASVADLNIPIVGQLNPASDSGFSNRDNITNITRPNFTGFAEANTVITLYAVAFGQSKPLIVGQGLAGANGAWSITTNKLVDGTYVVYATSADLKGHSTGIPNVLLPSATRGPLVIDTVGPHVTSSLLNPRTGQVTITFQDDRGGMNPFSVANPANYTLALNGGTGQAFPLVGLAPSSATPTGPQTVTATFALGRRGPASYVFRVPAAGITDAAGNTLVERFFIDFPQLANSPPGDYVAEFDTNGTSVALPAQFVPLPARNASSLFANFTRKNTRLRFNP